MFPHLDGLPYSPYRGHLYTPDELMQGYRPDRSGSYAESLDGRIYAHYRATGGSAATSILETVARRLHDHAMRKAPAPAPLATIRLALSDPWGGIRRYTP